MCNHVNNCDSEILKHWCLIFVLYNEAETTIIKITVMVSMLNNGQKDTNFMDSYSSGEVSSNHLEDSNL